MEEEDTQYPSPYSPPPLSLKQKLKQSLCFSCCFRRNQFHHPLDSPPPTSASDSTLLYRKRHQADQISAEFKGKCTAILSRVANPTNKHRRHSSTEFRYDPLSYSLNFEDGAGGGFDEANLMSFSARLPASPEIEKGRKVGQERGGREIAAVN